MSTRRGFSGRFDDLVKQLRSNPQAFGISDGDVVELVIEPPKGKGNGGFTPKQTPDKKKLSDPDKGENGNGNEWQDYAPSQGAGGSQPAPRPPQQSNDKNEKAPLWFNRRLKSVLKDNAVHRPAGNKRDGDLDNKHLYKAFTTGRCFKKKDVISKKEYGVALLVDRSGSMAGHKADLAAKCTYQFIDNFQKLVKLAVIVFDDRSVVIKDANKILKQEEIKPVVAEVLGGGGGTQEWNAFKTALEQVKKIKGKKIIIVVNDGEPNGDQRQPLLNEIRLAESRGIVCLGVGICSPSVATYYKEHIVVNDLQELYPSIIKLLQRTIKRGATI